MNSVENFNYLGYLLVIEEDDWYYRGKCKELDFEDSCSDSDFLKKDFKEFVDETIKDKENLRYGQEILAQDLFNSMLLYYPEALPEVIELLDKLHDQYHGRNKKSND